jgi:hypothetical protein
MMRDGMLPIVEVYPARARTGRDKRPCCVIYLIKFNGQIHEGGWANKAMAEEYANKLFNGSVVPKLLPKEVKV